MRNRMKHVFGKVWRSDSSDFQFLEQTRSIYTDKANAGITFSGGGTRSAVMTAGQLRALKKSGILDKVRYISCVSGGAWCAVPFTFLNEGISDATFLGELIDPKDITLPELEKDDPHSLTSAASHAFMGDDFIKNLFAGDERFAHMISSVFLKPFYLNSEDLFFSLDNESVQEIVTSTGNNLRHSDFYTVNTNAYRPYLLVGGTILRPKLQRYHFEMSPLYVGCYQFHPGAGSRGKYDIGGGYVEPFMFDSDSPEEDKVNNGDRVSVRLGLKRHMFTLSDVLGTTGAAPAEYAERFGLGKIGFPEFKYWNPVSVVKPTNGRRRAKEYDFGDGGILENLGIMPLLRRKVTRIIVFVNSQGDLMQGPQELASSIPPLFGPVRDKFGAHDFTDNIVFDNTNNQLEQLTESLTSKVKTGDLGIHTATYDVVKQDHYGIEGGWQTKVTWVYNSMPGSWTDRLPANILHRLQNGDFGKKFPYLGTFFENPPLIIDLKGPQAKLLAHLSAYVVNEGKDELTI